MFDDILLFVDLVKHASFYKLAKTLRISQPTLSRRIAKLEEDLDMRLISRNARNFELTEKGRLLYENFKHYKNQLQLSLDSLHISDDTAVGSLNIVLPQAFSTIAISPYLGEFIRKNPKLNLSITYQYKPVDLYTENYDIVVSSFMSTQSSIRVKTIYKTKLLICCAASYIKKYGQPKNIEDVLMNHFCVGAIDQNNSYIKYLYLFKEESDEIIEVPNFKFQLRVNNYEQIKIIAASGEMICAQPIENIHEELESGEFVRLFEDYYLGYISYYMASSLDPQDIRYKIFSQFIHECIDKLKQKFS